jgi:hypothetical protein
LLPRRCSIDPALDIHQHLWPEPFVVALRSRREPPRLDGWVLHLAGERPSVVRAGDHDLASHEQRLARSGTTAVVSLSSPLGVEDLAGTEGQHVLDAYHEGVRATGSRLGWWASLPREVALGDPSTAERRLSGLLGDGASGLQVPATWLDSPAGVLALRPLLSSLQEADRPLFVHPGRVPAADAGTDHPEWWAPVVDYSAQMAAAWWSWHAAGRAGLPTLRICFAAGAGLAPVHQERLRARGGQVAPVDPRTFVDLSGYGPQVFDALLRVLGIDALVSASDHPYAEAFTLPGDAAANHAIRFQNPHRLIHGGTP